MCLVYYGNSKISATINFLSCRYTLSLRSGIMIRVVVSARLAKREAAGSNLIHNQRVSARASKNTVWPM